MAPSPITVASKWQRLLRPEYEATLAFQLCLRSGAGVKSTETLLSTRSRESRLTLRKGFRALALMALEMHICNVMAIGLIRLASSTIEGNVTGRGT